MPVLKICDIREEGVCSGRDDLVDYFLDRIMPNFGMSSDLLRYRILNKYGGVYYDATDVSVNEKENVLETLPVSWGENNPHAIFIEHLSQVTKLPDKIPEFYIPEIGELKGSALADELTKVKLGNDSFICTSANPLMLKMISLAESGFKLTSLGDMMRMTYFAHNIHDITIEKTGPEVPQRIIRLKNTGALSRGYGGSYKKQLGNEVVLLRPLRCSSYQVTNPIKNTRNWTNAIIDVAVIQNKGVAFDKLKKMIRFEAENMSILRLDDHLNELKHVAVKLHLNYDQVCNDFIKYFDSSDIVLDRIKVVQNIANNPLVVDFYERKKLSKFDRLTNVTDLEEAFTLFQHITSSPVFTQMPMFTTLLENLDINIINKHITSGELRSIFDKLVYAINFIDYIKVHPAKLPTFDAVFKKYPDIDFTQHLGEIMTIFTPAFLSQDAAILKSQLRDMLLKLNKMWVQSEIITECLSMHKLVRQYGEDPERLLRVLANNNKVSDIQTFLKYYDVNINCQSSTDQRTPLHWAAFKGYNEVVALLLAKGAKDNIIDNEGKIPGDLAVGFCRELLSKPNRDSKDFK